MLITIDANNQTLWLFCTASKKHPIHFLWWLFFIGSSAFCRYIQDEESLVLEATGGYASYLNDKIERPHHTLAEWVWCLLINAGHPKQNWCYAAEHAAKIYCVMLHSSIAMSSDDAWYDTRAIYKDMHI
jgi:hypothetical protein